MHDSMAHPGTPPAVLELPGWKSALNWAAAILISGLFLLAGLWKITDVPGAAVRLAQARVPENLSLAVALILGTLETFAAVLILVPRFRRWGAWLAGALLVVFTIYIGANYGALRGAECQCFPWIKRAIGPEFFLEDGTMLLLTVVAGVWARPAESKRSAIIVLGAVIVFALVSYGVEITRQAGVKAPDTITVNGQPFSLQHGKIFIYFFNPECTHCLDAGRRMAALNWGDTKIVGVPTQQPQFAPGFMQMTGLRAGISLDLALLSKTFPFVDTPAGVAIENGRRKEAITRFDDPEPGVTLKKLGFVH